MSAEPDAPGRALFNEGVFAMLQLMVRALPWQSAGMFALCVVVPALRIGFVLASGRLVGSAAAALASGLSPATLAGEFALVAVLFGLQQVTAPVLSSVAASVGSRLAIAVREQVMRATLAPHGIAHLEDPSIVDEVTLARGVGPFADADAQAVTSLATVVCARLEGVASAVILAGFALWAPVLLGMGWALSHQWLNREGDTLRKQYLTSTLSLRRSGYYRELAIGPAAAKEVRVFGLGGWVLERLADNWFEGMREVWRERGKHRWWMGATVGGVSLTHLVVFSALALSGVRGEIGIEAIAIYAQAALGLMSLGSTGDADMFLRYLTLRFPRARALAGRTRTAKSVVTGTRPTGGAPVEEVRFEGVAFTYPGTDRAVFRSLDLTVPAGASLAIVGANGAGKTTLVKLLARLYDPDAGRILVDGVDLRELDPVSWRRRLSVIFQDFVRYELPARANVGYGAPSMLYDDAALDAAAELGCADDVLARLPHRWETILSRAYDGGTDLSGGEWQRIALARALLAVRAGAGLLVLDEPTANLDVRAEAELFQRLLDTIGTSTDAHRPPPATILISHRFSSVRHADRICVIDSGVVAEEGTHASLVAARGAYERMFTLQASRFEVESVG